MTTSIADKPVMDSGTLRPPGQYDRSLAAAITDKTRVLPEPSKTQMHHDLHEAVETPPQQSAAPKPLQEQHNVLPVPAWKKVLDQVESKSCWIALAANFIGAGLMKMGLSEATQKRVETVVSTILKLSFVPYGLSGISDGIVRNNIFTIAGFTGELIFPWLGNLKNIYLIRGLPTATDQLWTATDHHVPYKDGKFPDIQTGFKEVIKALGKLTKELWHDPLGSLFTLKTKGHHAFLSSLGSAAATIGFGLTGSDKIFGLVRDIAAPIFDWGMLLEKDLMKKFSGLFFIFEMVFDVLARYVAKANHNKLAFNMLSQGISRLALMLYKNSSPAATVMV